MTVLRRVPPRALVISIENDVLISIEHQIQLARCLPEAITADIASTNVHDGFLLEFEALSTLIIRHLHHKLPWVYEEKSKVLERPNSLGIVQSVPGEAGPDF